MHATKPVKGQYIVILDRAYTPTDVASVATSLTARHGGQLRRIMTSAANGFSVALNEQQALLLANEPGVLLVEENGFLELADAPRTSLEKPLPRANRRLVSNDSKNVGQNESCLTGTNVLV